MGVYTDKATLLALARASVAFIDGRGPRPTMPEGFAIPRRVSKANGPASVWPREDSTWRREWRRFEIFLDSGGQNPQWDPITHTGNGKLPFAAFSAAPDITCPGAGPCLRWCYSFKAWRYAAPYFRQLQNTILLRTVGGRAAIRDAVHAIEQGREFRLYVDGDFDSIETMAFWFELLGEREDLRAYGYSKSWPLFLKWAASGRPWPSNYQLNASSGSKYGAAMLEKIKALPVYRGTFDAIPAPYAMPTRAIEPQRWQQWAAILRQRARDMGMGKVFVCPGKCGSCTPAGHACGSSSFRGVPIVIGLH